MSAAAKGRGRQPHADITIRVFQPDHGEDGQLYENRQLVPVEYFSDIRYRGYVGFQFEEMYADIVRALNAATP